MNYLNKTLFSFCLIAFLFSSCDLLNKLQKPNADDGVEREKFIETDATPPSNYKPNYILKSKTFTKDVSSKEARLEIFRTEVEPNLVKLYVQVSDTNGHYLSGLSGAQFRKMWCSLTDSLGKKKSNISNFTVKEVTDTQRVPYALAIVLDHSGSMGDKRARVVQNASETFIKNKKDEDAFAIIKYDNEIVVENSLTTDKSQLLANLKKDGLGNLGRTTAVIDATYEGIKILKDAKGYNEKAVVVFTDGIDNASSVSMDSVIKVAKEENILICAFDFGSGVRQGFLERMTQPTNGSYYHTYATEEFNYVFDDIYKRLKNYYVIEFKPLTYGVHHLELGLCLDNDKITDITSYDNTPDVGKVALLNVNFDTGKSSLKASSKYAVNNIIGLMQSVPSMHIELRGHTDDTGDDDKNMELSQKRADSVKATLVKAGIAKERIKTKGFGETSPIADNKTVQGRALNRRTEFIILSR